MHQRPPTPSPLPRPASDPRRTSDDTVDESLLDALTPVEFEALRWSVRVGDGLSDAARAEWTAWLDAAPAHRAAYEEMAGVLDAVDELPPQGTARLRTLVAIDNAQASSASNAATAPPDARPADPVRPMAQAAPVAPARARRLLPHALAALVALAVLGGSWFGWDHGQRQPVFSQHFETQRGQNLQAHLPDGSRLQMDTATQAHVTLYRQRREVMLPEGQVVFQVQGDTARPFDVLAGATRITVVGTRFAVRYTPSLGIQAVQVAVMEGTVHVARAQGDGGPGDTVELRPGQTVSADAQGRLGAVERVATDAMAPWLGQRLSFDNAVLATVLAELQRYSDMPLRVASPAIGQLRVTASVDLRNIAGFVRSLPQVLPVRLRERDGATEIVAR